MLRNDAIEIWKAGVSAVHGRTLVENSLHLADDQLHLQDQTFNLNNFDRILIVGGGKFSHFMAEGIENVLGPVVSKQKQLSGLVTVPDGSNEQVQLNFIEATQCRPAGVNLPTDRVLAATQQMLDLLGNADERTLVLALISGGGSALLENSSLPLSDIIAATNWLSSRGANILQLNTVRIALSNFKGGGLARQMSGGTLVGLIVSDVPNDDLRFVSSGPTVDFGDGLFPQAKQVLDSFDATSESGFPVSAIDHINNGSSQPTSQASISNFLIGDANVARDAAVARARSLGYEIVPDTLAETETCEQIADAVLTWCADSKSTRQCIISLGEPTVEPGESAGQGGRNQHAVLTSIARLIRDQCDGDFCFMSAGTDGEDGNTPVAGAIVTGGDIPRLASQSAAINASLDQFDSHNFLTTNRLIFESGPTATNVADLRILLRS